MKLSAPVYRLKRKAKLLSREEKEGMLGANAVRILGLQV